MKPKTCTVLLIEDDPADTQLILEILREEPGNAMEILHVDNMARGLEDPGLEIRPLVEDFIRSYYGPAAPAMQEIYDFMAKIAAMEDRSQGPTLDMRKFVTTDECNQLFKLFAKAEDLAKDNAVCLARVKVDKGFLLYTDLAKHNPNQGNLTDMTGFKNKLSELLTLTLKGNSAGLFRKTLQDPRKARSWFWKTARLKLTSDKVKDDPIVQQLLSDPQSVAISRGGLKETVTLLPEAKGWRLPLTIAEGAQFRDGYKYECPPREKVCALQTRFTEFSLMRLNFDLPEDPGAATLAIEAQDDDKPGATRIRVALNSTELFKGPNQFPEHNWATCRYAIPAGTLKPGKNELVVEDMEEGENVQAQWVIVSDVRIETERVVKAPSPRTMLIAHFDKGFNADAGANPEARITGEPRLHPEGKWGSALDADYTEGKEWTLSYDAIDNYLPAQGTAEMWVKPR